MVLPELALYLESQGIGTRGVSIFRGTMPETDPADFSPVTVVLYEYGGLANEPDLGTGNTRLSFPSVQVVCRGLANDYDTPRQKAQDIVTALTKVLNQTLSGVSYKAVAPKQDPFFLRRDDNRRTHIVCNFQVTKSYGPSFYNLAQSLNPVVYYRFNEASSALPVVDASVNNLAGTYTFPFFITCGEPGATADGNAAIEIAGTSFVRRLDTPLLHSLTSMTAILFVRASTSPPSVPAPNRLFSEILNGDLSDAIFYLQPNVSGPPDTQLMFNAHSSSGALGGAFNWTNNAWHMLVGVYDAADIGNQQKVYVDNQLLASVAGDAMSFAPNGFMIGDSNGDSIHDAPWVRDFDEFLLFNYALTTAQLSALFTAISQR